MKNRTTVAWVLFALLVVGALAWAFRPKPVAVETATARIGPLQETVDEEGKTRMHDRFLLTAGVPGKLRRIELHAGDSVRTGEVIAWIDPTPIEPRQTAVLRARLDAARAAQLEADALVGHAKAQNDQAAIDLERTRKLFEQGVASREAFDRAGSVAASAAKQLEAATSKARSAAYHVKEASAELLTQNPGGSDLPVSVKSPVDGRILKLVEQSERVLAPGAPIVEIGYTPRLEVVAEFLSRDAVKVRPAMDAIITDWGGDRPLRARVRMVEPGGFTKISALGIEEQRVNIVLDFLDGSDSLADGYRVEVHIVIWQASNTLMVPSSAVFRSGENWALFTVKDRRARKTIVRLGHRGAFDIEVLHGLAAGDVVIMHPGADVKDGVRVSPSAPSESASAGLS